MPEYKAYLTVETQRSRKSRKRSRRETFEYNKLLNKKIKREKKDAKKA